MIELEKEYKHQLVYDGDQHGFYHEKIFNRFEETDFVSLEKANSFISEFEIEQIVFTLSAYKRQPFGIYKTKLDDLTLSYVLFNEDAKLMMLIISEGETQPGRYKIFLEGLWRIIS